MEKNKFTAYVLVATAFGHKDQTISTPMDKEHAEALADKIEDAMKDLDVDFQIFQNVKIKEYTPEPLYIDKQKNDPYEYSVLDGIDSKVKLSILDGIDNRIDSNNN